MHKYHLLGQNITHNITPLDDKGAGGTQAAQGLSKAIFLWQMLSRPGPVGSLSTHSSTKYITARCG